MLVLLCSTTPSTLGCGRRHVVGSRVEPRSYQATIRVSTRGRRRGGRGEPVAALRRPGHVEEDEGQVRGDARAGDGGHEREHTGHGVEPEPGADERRTRGGREA